MNVGKTDKVIRLIAGIALIAASFLALGGVSTTIGVVAGVVGLVLIATAMIKFCPIYKILGLNSCGKGLNT